MFRFFRSKARPPVNYGYAANLPLANWTLDSFVLYAEKFYNRNPIVANAIGSIASNVASVPLYVVDAKSSERPNHPALELLKSPSLYDNYNSFITRTVTHYLLSGNAYILRTPTELSSPPDELLTLRPDTVKKNISDTGIVLNYEVGNGIKKIVYDAKAAGGYSPILHWHNTNPLYEHMGVSPMGQAAMAADIHNEISRWNKSLMQNNARPSGALKVKGSLSDEQAVRLKAELDEVWSGSSNAGRPLLLDGDMEWEAMSSTPKDLDFIQNQNEVARMVCIAFKYPALLLGMKGDNTYANYTEARIALYQDTVLPMLDSLCAALSAWLFRFYPQSQGLRLTYDKDKIPALFEQRMTAFERLNNVQFLTDDEKRELTNYPAIEGGAVLYKPAGLLPAGFDVQSLDPNQKAALDVFAVLRERGTPVNDARSMCEDAWPELSKSFIKQLGAVNG